MHVQLCCLALACHRVVEERGCGVGLTEAGCGDGGVGAAAARGPRRPSGTWTGTRTASSSSTSLLRCVLLLLLQEFVKVCAAPAPARSERCTVRGWRYRVGRLEEVRVREGERGAGLRVLGVREQKRETSSPFCVGLADFRAGLCCAFERALRDIGFQMPSATLDYLWQILDTDQDGK
eukprot:2143078-Rhodomonas_salina.1